MDQEQTDPALRAANLALNGRRVERATSRFASIELRNLEVVAPSAKRNLAWEFAAMISVGTMALLAVVGIWCL
jgi:hypothetical protein